jgi:5-methylcytosine-specific restriction endonuclease McrA
MSIHMVQDHTNQRRLGEVALDQGFHPLGNIASGATVGHLDIPPAGQRLEQHQEMTAALAPIRLVVAGGAPRAYRERRSPLAHPLIRRLLNAYDGIASVIQLGLQGQDVFHAPDERCADRRYTPRFPAPGLQRIVLSVRRTVASERASMTRCATSLWASRGIVHRLRPSGGVLHASATTSAACWPSSVGRLPGRGRSDKAAATPLFDTAFARALDSRPADVEGGGDDVVSCPSLRLQQHGGAGQFPGGDMPSLGESHSLHSFVVRERDELLLGHGSSPFVRQSPAGRITPQNRCGGPLARQRRLIHRLLDRFRRTDPLPHLRRNISRAEQEINEAEHRLHLCERLPAHVKAARARHRSKRIAVEQRQHATTRVWLEKQGQRASQFQDVLDKVKLDRHLLLIRNKDYKRGNPLDNLIRSKWNQVIQAAFAGRCFICGVSSDLTIDHLWLPKNEGGNFVMCVRESALLMSNLLLLCRSCNAAKGEAPVERFFSPDQMIELVDIQKLLSKPMMNDRELRRVAGRWSGRVIHPMSEPLA